ncbi:phage recombination protein Bet [Streptomyces tubercidicus]|uniref:phage recombination protein Bet n=1 Tax=Streptomyces tubercidicus TaxID=47759 RepID=UPI003254C6CD
MTQQSEQPTKDIESTEAEAPVTPTSLPRPAAASAVVIRRDQEEFNERQVAALALISPGLQAAPRAQLAVFFHYCVRSGLDPFARQIYMIGRKNRGDDREENPVNFTIQTGIDGFRTIAHRAAERTGERISYEDTVYYDGEGNAFDVWLQNGSPQAVKVTVLRGASRFPFVARWGEFAPTYWDAKANQYQLAKMWRTMQSHMLRKCAEAGALRMAAPQDLSGMYVDEEMAQADAEVVAGVAEEATRRLRAAAGLEHDSRGGGDDVEDASAPGDSGPQEEKGATPKRAAKSAQSKAQPQNEEATETDEKPPPRKRTTSRKRASSAKSGTAS